MLFQGLAIYGLKGINKQVSVKSLQACRLCDIFSSKCRICGTGACTSLPGVFINISV